MANIVIAYIFWLLGGPFGLHHFYLGRDRHALVWFISFGGLALGWFRDLWRLPEYVYESNQDVRYLNEFRTRRRFRPKPPFSVVRFAGQLLIGVMLCHLFRLFISEKFLQSLDPFYFTIITSVLPILGCTIGVYLVANISHRKVAWRWCLIGSAIGLPWLLLDQPSLHMSPLIAACFASWKSEWDPDWKPPKGKCKCVQRSLVLTGCVFVYLAMWGSGIFFNVHITTEDGMKIPVSEAVENFFTSPAWKEFKKSVSQLYELCQHNGWDHCYNQLIQHLDPSGESHAYKVLEFEGKNPTPKEITARCRQLSRKWHPDTFKTEIEKEAAQEKFIEIQKACETLNEMRKRRSKKNMKSDTTEDTSSGKKGHKHTEF